MLRCAAQDRTCFHAPFDERSGLEALQADHRVDFGPLLRKQVKHLTASHSRAARSQCQITHELASDCAVGVGCAVGEYLEGQRVQRIARQNGRGLAEGLMNRRLAPPQVIVVHAGKVVMDQRMNVDAFHCQPCAQRRSPRHSEQIACSNHEKGPEPFPTRDRGMTHRLIETIATIPGQGQRAIQQFVYIGAGSPEGCRQEISGVTRLQHGHPTLEV